jgi:hypothetical protein
MLKKPIILFIVLFLHYHQALSFPIPDTGQTVCYDYHYAYDYYQQEENSYSKEIPCPKPGKDFYGQDGNFIINLPSYTKLDEKGDPLSNEATTWAMVKDNVTGLIWENKTDDGSIHDKDKRYSWQEAQDIFISGLNKDAFGNATDWRLPTIEELASSASLETYSPAIDCNWFSNPVPEFYWSATSNPYFADYALGINFQDGYDYQYEKNSSYYVRAVRGGRARSFDHLVKNQDGTITDSATGLMWQAETESYTKTWTEALSYCDQLTLADYSDWRLPSREELRSIVDYSKYGASIFGAFIDNASDFYWSSTSVASDIDLAWGIRFNGGFDNRYSKYLTYAVRAVRGGQYRLSDHLLILSPKQGEVLEYGNTLSIIWDTTNIGGNVKISLSTNGGKSFSIIAIQTENDGHYDWSIPEINSVNCVLKIEPDIQPYKLTAQGLFSIYPPSPVVKGRVTGVSTNEILSDVTISINGQSTQTNSNGDYELTLTQPGSYTIVYTKSDYVTKIIKNFDLKSGHNFLYIDMARPGSVAGIISDVEDNVIPGVHVTVKDQTVKTNSQGKYNIDNLAPGNVAITFSHPLYTSVTIDNLTIQPLTCTTLNYNLSKPILLNIATMYLPDAEIEDYYERKILANGEMPFTFTIASGNLPPGLSLNPQSGTISGKLQSSGTYTFNIGISDAADSYAEREFTIDVIDHLSIITQFLHRGTTNTEYVETILATGGTPPYTFTLASGSLPTIVLSTTGEITGLPTRSGIFKATIQVTDSYNRKENQLVTIQIVEPLKIQTNQLNDGIINVQYNQSLSASGGYGNYTWTVYSGTLPNMLRIDNNTQQLIGKPDQTAYKSIILSVTDSDGRLANKDFILQIVHPLTIPMSKFPNALKNELYSESIPIRGGIGSFTYACEGLPPDLTIDPSTGIISGKSIIGGYNNIEIQVIDSTWPTPQKISLKTGIRTTSMLTILTNAVLPRCIQGNSVFMDPLRVSGVSSTYEWSCIKGSLPEGIQLDKTNGCLSGSPMNAGTQLFTLQVTDDQNQTAEKEFIWHITDTLTMITQQLPNAAENFDYNCVLEAAGGEPPYEWRIQSGELPLGLLLNESGRLYGKPQKCEAVSFIIQVEDSGVPSQRIEQPLIISVGNDLKIITEVIQQARQYEYYSATLQGVGGIKPYQWQLISGELPKCTQLDSTTGRLYGRPESHGNFDISIRLSDQSTPMKPVVYSYNFIVEPNDTWIEGDFNKDRKIDLQDVILSIQMMVDMMITIDGWMDINQDCQLGFQETIGLMKKLAL